MDPSVQRLLTDKLYDKRKQGALELERLVRESSASKDHEKIGKIVDQLCLEYAYAVHQPHARNGGLIGLAATSIALGSEEVAPYLQEIVPPVLACFTDQDARVRYYACESMYNIAKVAKGEILLFFNEIFDSLCKLAADSELSVKNGAELLDRLVKDIVSESAASYVSILQYSGKRHGVSSDEQTQDTSSETSSTELPTAFSLARFIPLLQDRIHVINPFTRTFLVSWLTLLDTIPDLELVTYLPAFLGGLFRFLSDPNRDVYVATQGLLERFLNEIKKIARIKRGIEESRKSRSNGNGDAKSSLGSSSGSNVRSSSLSGEGDDTAAIESVDDNGGDESNEPTHEDDWVPGQDVMVDHAKILDILLQFVDSTTAKAPQTSNNTNGLTGEKDEEIGIVALRWIDSFFEISPEDILQFVPRLLSQVLPALSAPSDQVRTTASRVNNSLMDYIVSFAEEGGANETPKPATTATRVAKEAEVKDRRPSGPGTKSSSISEPQNDSNRSETPQEDCTPRSSLDPTPQPQPISDLDYAAAVNALTLQFLNENEATRVAALSWLIMLHRKAPKKVVAFNDGTFPALLKTLSDPSESVVTRDLQLLSQISRNSEDGYFASFMVNLLQLFSTDRKLLENRGNLIIRQLCMNLSPERIYRTLADCLEKDEDIEFASIMIQNLNNNLITAPELADMRKRLRNLETKEGQMFFVALFRSWCYNAVATFSLCLLAQAYEQAYNLLQIFAELEMTVNMLIQIDKLVQLLESPVFTYLRLQLLEPERYPYLYKCLYGLLMLLPQSSAFAALKNRLNSVSSIGLIHTPARPSLPGTSSSIASTTSRLSSSTTTKSRSESTIPSSLSSADNVKWVDLLEKFRSTQEKARRRNRIGPDSPDLDNPRGRFGTIGSHAFGNAAEDARYLRGEKALPDIPLRSGPVGIGINNGSDRIGTAGSTDASGIVRPGSGASGTYGRLGGGTIGGPSAPGASGIPPVGSHGHQKSKGSLSNFGRLGSIGKGNKGKR
ncbi:putative vacuole-associated enzyme activator complex component [Phaeomoniella chlamydospora]|uniref:Putative vacuole-associated enzyme activator complex component n=1 Tax=Phaeomoniella chlamydospora TaxID=158046 RepID=A0A0G2ES71_PHACM|nr:putative vacuole-associated enzyme activator complex component [Phaeomoniella chlamydospora]